MTDAAWHALGYLLAGMGVAVYFVGRRRGRARSERCPRCSYSMVGLLRTAGVSTCPECGFRSPDARAFFRTRPPRAVGALAVFMMAGAYPAWCRPRVVGEGWRGWIPTTLLMATAAGPAHSPTGRRSMAIEVLCELAHRRAESLDCWDWQAWLGAQRIALAYRLAAGDERGRLARVYNVEPLLGGHFREVVYGDCFGGRTSQIEWFDERERIQPAVTTMVHPELWVGNGGTQSHIDRLGTCLIVWAPEDHQHAVRALLDSLGAPVDERSRMVECVEVDHLRTAAGSAGATTTIHDLREFVEDEALWARGLLAPGEEHSWRTDEDVLRDVADMIMCSIDCDGWVANGGERSDLMPLGSKVIVQAPPQVQREVRDLLGMLHAARERPPRIHLRGSWSRPPRPKE